MELATLEDWLVASMIENTFCHIPGIGEKTEERLWDAGLLTWPEMPTLIDRCPVSRSQRLRLMQNSEESRLRLLTRNTQYFAHRLPPRLHWRLFREFRESVAYVDIETTGLGEDDDYITTIALYDGNRIRHYVHDQNLLEFREDINEYKLLVTYNGKCFDIPFLQRHLGIPMNIPHIDLRFVLRSLGYRGGLKSCEKQFGLHRGELDGVDGYFAVLLWQDYLRHDDERALETLLAYNIEDVLSLETLMVGAYNLNLRGTPFADCNRIAVGPQPESPLAADVGTIDRVMGDWMAWRTA